MRFFLFVLFILLSTGCVLEKGTITVKLLPKREQLNITISNIQIINNQVVISGSHLNAVTKLNVAGAALAIESKTDSKIVANTISNVVFAADQMISLVVSSAAAATTYAVNFSLCQANLNGAGFDCSVNAQDHDVLSYDQGTNKWKPRSINGLTYKGTFDASTGAPVSGGVSSAGEYYIISVAGNGYTVGDWAVDNGATMDKIDNSPSSVSTVFSRIGAVTAQEGDYTLEKLADVTLGTPVTGNVLKYNGAEWVAGTITSIETDPTVSAFAKTALPTCAAGEVLKSNGTTLSCVTDNSGASVFTGTANRVVTTNGSGALTTSSISDTILGYLSGVTSNIQTQLDSKASSSSVVDWSVHSGTGPYIYPTRIYGGAIQPSKTLVTDVSGNIVTSSVTPSELNYLTGVTSNIQTQLNAATSGSAWTVASGDAYRTTGSVGVGTSTPAAKMDVAGEVKVGNTSLACSSTTKGSIRYNSGTNVLEFCNGSDWSIVQATACSNATPSAFSFTDEASATDSTLYTSNIVQITGINCVLPVSISGQGSPQYRICSDVSCSSVVQGWTSGVSTISTGQYVQVRLTTDNVSGSIFKATIVVGSGSSVWSVTTSGGDCTASPSIGTICADGTVYAGLSPDGNVKMFATRCDLGQTWDGVGCTGSRLVISWNNSSNTYVATNIRNVTTGQANSAALAVLNDAASPYLAAQACESLNLNGHTDWYLPSLNELLVLVNSYSLIKNFNANYYWSSTELSDSIASYVRFTDGAVNYNFNGKPMQTIVRCTRR